MDADELARLTKKLSVATKTMREEAKEREAEQQAQLAVVARECLEMRRGAEAQCDGLRAAAEPEITEMITAAHEEVRAMSEQTTQEKAEWKNELKAVSLVHRSDDEIVTFSVGGTHFSMYSSNFRKRQNSKTLLAQMLSRHESESDLSEPIFIDRDAHTFRYIMQFIRSPDQFRIPKDVHELEQLIVEAMAYSMPPSFYGTIKDEPVELFTDWHEDSVYLPNPNKSWNQSLSVNMFDDNEAPVIIHFDGQNDGIIQFNVGEPFIKLQIRNGLGMRFSVEALEDGVWEQVADVTLTKSAWNPLIEWKPRRHPAVAWRLVLKKNTDKQWLQNFRWWKVRSKASWTPFDWAQKHLSKAQIKKIRDDATA